MLKYEDITYAIKRMVVPNVYEYEIGNIDNYAFGSKKKLIEIDVRFQNIIEQVDIKGYYISDGKKSKVFMCEKKQFYYIEYARSFTIISVYRYMRIDISSGIGSTITYSSEITSETEGYFEVFLNENLHFIDSL